MTNLGFIGLGIMGRPMAGHLIGAGYKLYVYDRIPKLIKNLATRGGIPCGNPREVAEKADIIFIVVPDTSDVEDVIFGKDGVALSVRAGSIVVDMSSISPLATREFGQRLEAMGVEMLDAPVSGGQVGAEAANLSIMVGGQPEVYEQVRPYFEIIGKNIMHIGSEHGDGQTCKVANQIAVALTILAVSESLLFASKAGADPSKVRKAMLGGFAQSQIMDLCGARMIERRFTPGFRICQQQKDLKLALEAACSLGISLPGTALAQELLNAVAGNVGGNLDHSAMAIALERLASWQIHD